MAATKAGEPTKEEAPFAKLPMRIKFLFVFLLSLSVSVSVSLSLCARAVVEVSQGDKKWLSVSV